MSPARKQKSVEKSLQAAVAQYQGGRLDAAEKACRRILAKNPRYASALHLLGLVDCQRGRFASAIPVMEQALKLEPDNAELQHHCALAYLSCADIDNAIARFERALSLRPEFSDALQGLGAALVQAQRAEEAIVPLQQLVDQAPDSAAAHNSLGVALQVVGRLQAALTHFQLAVKLDPGFAEAENNLGKNLVAQGGAEKAIAHFERALELRPDHAETLNNLGVALTEVGRADEAAVSLQQAVAIAPDYAEAQMNLMLVVHDPELATARIAEVERVLRGPALSPEQKCQMRFALGNLYDRQAAYDKAFQNFLLANQQQAASCPFDEKAYRRYIDRLVSTFNAAFFEACAWHGDASELPVFIVGMPRSGTTLVEQILASHAQVSGGGELEFFSRTALGLGRSSGSSEKFPRSIAWLDEATATRICTQYLNCLRRVSDTALRVTDKMPDNYHYLGLIAVLFPNARVIHCRRDPLDTCLSNYFQRFESGNCHSYDFKRLATYYQGYERLMAHWHSVLPIRLLDLRYEELVDDQEAQSRRLIEFLDLGWDDACLEFHKHSRTVRTASKVQVREPIYAKSVGRWKHYAPYIGALINALEISPPAAR